DDRPLRWDTADRDGRGLRNGSGGNCNEVRCARKLMQFLSGKIAIDHMDSRRIGKRFLGGLQGRLNFRCNGAGEQKMVARLQVGIQEGSEKEIYAFARFLQSERADDTSPLRQL